MLKLIFSKRFGPFFFTQFMGAFNDNVYKNSLVILIAFRFSQEDQAGILINIATGLFILPFLLFSIFAGQLADKFEKPMLIRWIKLSEIIIMMIGALGLFIENVNLLMAVLFLMGCQSAFFGPIKFSILPNYLKRKEITLGTSLIEMGTFIAILVGTIVGGILIQKSSMVTGFCIILFAILGWFFSLFIPSYKLKKRQVRMNYNIKSQIRDMSYIIRDNRSIYIAIILISWFWFVGAIILSQIPTFIKYYIHGDESMVTFLLAVFTLSIALGSLLCAFVSKEKNEIGLVPLGGLGMSLFIGDLFFVNYSLLGEGVSFTNILGLSDFWPLIRVVIDFLMIGISGSFFIVPLYTLLQTRSDSSVRSRVIAANNVFNSIFMITSAGLAAIMFKLNFFTLDILFLTAAINLFLCGFVFIKNKEYLSRISFLFLKLLVYKFSFSDKNLIELQCPFIVVSNGNRLSKMLVHYCFERPVVIKSTNDFISKSDKGKVVMFEGDLQTTSHFLRKNLKELNFLQGDGRENIKIFKLKLDENSSKNTSFFSRLIPLKHKTFNVDFEESSVTLENNLA